jgi:hypothetical protein
MNKLVINCKRAKVREKEKKAKMLLKMTRNRKMVKTEKIGMSGKSATKRMRDTRKYKFSNLKSSWNHSHEE